jgi:HTH-type transcriptional regulator/antitoxin HigA
MKELKFKIIKTREQYDEYCTELERLVFLDKKSSNEEDAVELLTYLIELYDKQNTLFDDMDPISVIRTLMDEHKLKAVNLAKILGIGKGQMSDILNYKKGLSKEVIRGLSQHFKVEQELFNRPYELKSVKRNPHYAKLMNAEKDLKPTLD